MMTVDTATRTNRFANWVAAPTAVAAPPLVAVPTPTEQVLAAFAPVAPKQLGKRVPNRAETKYVVSADLLSPFLNAMRDDYDVLVRKGQRLNRQRTLYFDSADFNLYRRHHAGAANRYKVRSRHYAGTGKNILEIKHKDQRKRTHKIRYQTDAWLRAIDPKTGDLLRHHYPHSVDLLYGQLLTDYSRITLVSRTVAERVTIDLDLRFEGDGRREALSHIAVITLKHAPHAGQSAARAQLRRLGQRPQRFSKFCIGVSLIYPQVKHNNFKPTLRLIHTLSQGAFHAY